MFFIKILFLNGVATFKSMPATPGALVSGTPCLIKFVKASESIYKFLTELSAFKKPSASMICKVCIIETS